MGPTTFAVMAVSFHAAIVAMAPAASEPVRVWHVDADADCDGDGSTEAPLCALSDVPVAELEPGHAIRLRSASVPYAAYAGVTLSGAPSGTEAAPIVIEPAPGHRPIIEGAVRLEDVSHWTVRGLVVEGGNGHALSSMANDGFTSTGVRFVDNTIGARSGGGVGLSFAGTGEHVGTEIRGNLIVGARSTGVSVTGSRDAVVESNQLIGLRCASTDFGPNQLGIVVAQGSTNVRVAYNSITDFPDDCPETDHRRVGIRVRSGSTGTVIERNFVRGLPAGEAPSFVGGISVHEDASAAIVRRNIVADIGGCGLCDAADFGQSSGNAWTHNTVVSASVALAVGATQDIEVYNNILLVDDANPAADVTAAATVAQWDHNLYASSGGDAPTLRWQAESGTLADWQSACACDANAVAGDPLLSDAPSDFTPQPGSPALDAGRVSGEDFTGAAPDIGALEVPFAERATIDPADALLIRIGFGATPFGPLQPSGCGGLSVETAGERLAIASCDLVGGDMPELHLRVEAPSMTPTPVEVTYWPGPLSDSIGIGGALAARVPPFAFELTIPELDADPSRGSASGASGDDEFPDPDLGCACAVGRDGVSSVWWLLLIVLPPRRRCMPPSTRLPRHARRKFPCAPLRRLSVSG